MPWNRAVVVWIVIIAIAGVQSWLWQRHLAPVLGELSAGRLGLLAGLLLILAIACVFSRWLGPRGRGAWMRIGLLWVVLTAVFTAGQDHWGFGYSWNRVLAGYDPSRGGLMGLKMLGLLYAPRVAARIRGTLS